MTKIEVTCPEGHKFWMEDYERKACPKCGKLVIGPKAGSGSGMCFITTACVEAAGLFDNCNELETMRYLRDEYLAKSVDGKRMIQEYYEIAPSIVEKMKREDNSKEVFCDIFNDIMGTVSLVKSGDLESATARYGGMVVRLKQRYMKTRSIEEV